MALADVRSYTVSPDSLLLIVVDGKGVQRYSIATAAGTSIAAGGGDTYSDWTWSASGNSLVAKSGATEILVISGLAGGAPTVKRYSPANWGTFPAVSRLSAPFVWRADERGLFFHFTRSLEPQAAQGFPVAIWSSRAESLPAEAAWETKRAAFRADLAILTLASGNALPLTDRTVNDGTIEEMQILTTGDYLLGFSSAAYGWRGSWNDRAGRRDYFLIDIKTGARTDLVKGLRVYSRNLRGIPLMSPDGQSVVWRDNEGNWVACDVATRKPVSLTESLHVPFYYEENDPRTSRQLVDPIDPAWGIQGWVPERNAVLISDSMDVWELSLRGGAPRNLTGDGRKRGIRYGLYALTAGVDDVRFTSLNNGMMSRGALPVPARAPWYFYATEIATGRRGLSRLDAGDAHARDLVWDFAETIYIKAARADTWVVARSNAAEALDYYLMDSSWRRSTRLTDSNPQQRNFKLSPGAKYLTYQTSRGETRHAILHLPAGYQPGKRYPTLIIIYQQLSEMIHMYDPFGYYKYPWVYSGYAVLLPDIVPRPDAPGQAAVDSVSAAIDAAVATGVVDRERIGLHGHSYGGYETYYIATRTSLVKAAVPYAGMTDVRFDEGVVYNEIYDGTLFGPFARNTDAGFTQPFLTPPWWENEKVYYENSPLNYLRDLQTPLLMVHGDKDRAVRFFQAELMFNSLRLLGNSNVVMLQYPGEEHDLKHAARRDLFARMLQFFDHFLQGKDAPSWWASGKAYPVGTAPAK